MNTSSTSQMEVCGACWGIPLTHFTAFSTAELMMAEAVGLVNTLDNWRVVDKIILSTKTPEKKRIFGKGNFQSLTGIIHPVSVNLWLSECVWIWLIICFLSFPPGSEKIRQTAGITAVFVNVERLSPLSEVSSSEVCSLAAYWMVLCTDSHFFPSIQRELEEAWGVKVFDRYSVVLHIFRCNARTKEAKLQISLAEIPLLR